MNMLNYKLSLPIVFCKISDFAFQRKTCIIGFWSGFHTVFNFQNKYILTFLTQP